MVDFSFDDTALAFRDEVRALLADRCPPDAVRAAWEAPAGKVDRSGWDGLAAMGVLDVLVPEAAGGLGLDERALVLVLQEAGYAGLPQPLVETAAVAAPLLAAAGRPLPAGVVVATDLGGPPLVPWAGDADLFLLGAPDGSLHLLGPDQVLVEPTGTVDRSRRAGRVAWEPSPATALPTTAGDAAHARRRGAFGTAAVLVGVARRMLDLAVAHTSSREQFGRPVGSFQAVKHRLADAAVRLEFATPVVHRAAWSLAVGAPDASRDVAMAKAMASDAAAVTGRAALQCHGAIGYTTEYDLHLFLKRAWALGRAWGDAASQRDEVGRALGV